MGGQGSGSWYRLDRKSTVEESMVLSMRDLRGRILQNTSGTVTWTWSGGNESSVGYFVAWNDGVPMITLQYHWRGSEEIRIPIRLQATSVHFGGQRWWFTCPLIVNEVACNHRAGKLYLPPGARHFGCRQCHGLTYRSSQAAHQMERLFGQLGNTREMGWLMAAKMGQSG
jgi:hypothetical protein